MSDFAIRHRVVSKPWPFFLVARPNTLYKYAARARTEPQIIPEEIAGILPAHASKSRSITFGERARGRSTFRRIKIPR